MLQRVREEYGLRMIRMKVSKTDISSWLGGASQLLEGLLTVTAWGQERGVTSLSSVDTEKLLVLQ